MSGEQLLEILTWGLFLVIFLVALAEALRRPSRSSIDVALLFSGPALASALGLAGVFGVTISHPLLSAITASLVFALPYLLLRLVDDFYRVPPGFMRATEAGLLLLVVGAFAFAGDRPVPYALAGVTFFMAVLVYGIVAFGREAHHYTGVTRRRMEAVSLGMVMVGLTTFSGGLSIVLPQFEPIWGRLASVSSLAAGISLFLGFATPAWVRRAWQEPEFRAFLSRSAALPYLPDTESVIRELETGAATSLGATRARIGLWDESSQVLRFSRGGRQVHLHAGETTAGKAFLTQQPCFSMQPSLKGFADYFRGPGIVNTSILAAPITAGGKRHGVLLIYASRAPIFARDDLALVLLVANQAAGVLESRSLIDEAARLRAREEVSHLKEDFLSAAAHDIKSPITVILTQAQLMERKLHLRPLDPADPVHIQRLITEARRLKSLVDEMIDAARVDQVRLSDRWEPVDLSEVVREACASHPSPRHRCRVEVAEPVVGEYDRARILQLVDNLVENAIKYSPKGGDIVLKTWLSGEEAHLTVTDRGIGIPPSDLPRIFTRFHRGTNVDDRHFAGMGLGLYMCRKIVDEHGGRFWVTSDSNHGTTFHIVLPALQVASGGLDHEQRSHSGR